MRLCSNDGGGSAAEPYSHAARYREPPLAYPLRLRTRFPPSGGNDPMVRLLLAAALALPCFGCASVTRGTTENISISSTPRGATGELSGLDNPTACVTPCVVVAKRNADITVTINKEGYEPQVIPLTKEVPGTGAAGVAGNLLAGGLGAMGRD